MTTLGTFVDHYILLLAARYGAPFLSDSAEDILSDPNMAASTGVAEQWEWVADDLQKCLRHPRTTAEHRQLQHLDVCAFTATVCRERATYLNWQHRQNAEERRSRLPRSQAKLASASMAPPTADGERPSGYDVTRDSIARDVSSIFEAVRRALPSAVVDEKAEEDEDGWESPVGGGMVSPGVVPIPLSGPEESQRNRALAAARDTLLDKVQQLQAEFYAAHHRWVDVPDTILDPPPLRAAALTPSHNNNVRKELPSAAVPDIQQPLRALTLAALRRSVHVDRPIRPSAAAPESFATISRKTSPTKTLPTAATVEAAQRPIAAPPPPRQLSSTDAAALNHRALPVPTASPAAVRANRWQVVEYEEETEE